jgi:tRNA threonylcarbamoyladenosine biosynthesis protein TsaB
MRALALDTTTRVGSGALVENDRVVIERPGDPARSHAERLPAELLNLLEASDVRLSDVDVFAVAAGPGSFTGLRIGIATIQGLAFTTRRRVVPVSVLEALAQAGGRQVAPGSIVGAWMDAHRREVFSALYRVVDGSALSRVNLMELDPPAVGFPEDVLKRWGRQFGEVAAIVGDGAVVYANHINDKARVVAPPALAGTIGLMAIARASAGESVDPAGVQPLYVRRPDAEIAKDRKKLSTREDIEDAEDHSFQRGN